MSGEEHDALDAEEAYFQSISPSLVHQWRKIRSVYPKNTEEEAKAIAKTAAALARLQRSNESRRNRVRGRESRIKLVDEDEEDLEEERPAKRRKIAKGDEKNSEDEQNDVEEESDGHNLPPEVVSMVFDQMDLIEIYRYCVLVSKAWKFMAATKIEKAFERLSEEIKEHTKKYPKYMKCQDYFPRIKKLMPQFNNILPQVYHRIKQTLAVKQDKRELFTITAESAEDEISRKDRHLFSFERTGYVIKDKTVEEEIMPIGCSKLGGVPDLPPSIEWPTINGEAHRFFAQLRLDELSLFDICGLLPWTTGMLYFFDDEKIIYYDGDMTVLAPRDHTGLKGPRNEQLEPESCCEIFFDLSFMKPDEETWHRGRYFDAKEGIQKKNGLHVLGYPEFDYEEMPGFESEEAENEDQDGYVPEVPSMMLFGTISADTFYTMGSRAYSWTITYENLGAKNLDSVHFEIGGD